ncbi:DUF1932 domain-containing protein [Streptomyces longispororuber]|uniref:DUF1932 domain-containing protein n=1 Tax=Streptomyces longispororuber TaxID=68230 RepID=UPI003408B321
MTTVTLLHPGAMGAALGSQLTVSGYRVLWVPSGRSTASHERAEQAALRPAESLSAALAQSDIVLSVCPPHGAERLAASVASCGYHGIFVEANAISPQRMLRIAAGMPSECTVLDGAVIGPPPAEGRTARLYLAGPDSARTELAKMFAGTTVTVKETGSEYGTASALKMAFASYQKAARALAGVAHALADAHGVAELLTAEAEIMTGRILSDPEYLSSVAARAWRWAPEMQEIEEALRAVSLPTDFSRAAAAVLKRWESDKDRDLPLETVLSQLRSTAADGTGTASRSAP